jgi:hypothetical protein
MATISENKSQFGGSTANVRWLGGACPKAALIRDPVHTVHQWSFGSSQHVGSEKHSLFPASRYTAPLLLKPSSPS